MRNRDFLIVMLAVSAAVLCWWVVEREPPSGQQPVLRSGPLSGLRMDTGSEPPSKRLESFAFRPAPLLVPLSKAPKREIPPDWIITGQITQEQGVALKGATISLFEPPDECAEQPTGLCESLFEEEEPVGSFARHLAQSFSDSNGHYALSLSDPPPLEGVWLSVGAPGYARIVDPVEMEEERDIRRNYTLYPASAALHGQVFSGSSIPLAGALVSVSFNSTAEEPVPWGRLARTDREGRFSITRLPASSQTLLVAASAPGHLQLARRIQLSGNQTNRTEFILPVADRVELRVVDEEGRPVDGALARAIDLRDDRLPVSRSDQAGTIHILLPPNRGPMECRIWARGFEGKVLKISPRKAPARVVLRRAPEWAGCVNSRRGMPIEGARITIWGPEELQDRTVVRSDGTGCFSVALSSSPASRIAVRKEGFVPREIEAAAELNSPVTITLEEAEGAIFGWVYQAPGRPADTFTIQVAGEETNFRLLRHFRHAGGRFEIANLPSDTFQLQVVSLEENTAGKRRIVSGLSVRPGFATGPLNLFLFQPKE